MYGFLNNIGEDVEIERIIEQHLDRLDKDRNVCCITERERMLEEVIWDAVTKLEETKRYFKSKKIKEVKEDLIEAVRKENAIKKGRFASRHQAGE